MTATVQVNTLILLALLALVPLASAEIVIVSGTASPASTAAAWNDLGNSLSEQKRWDMAIDAFDNAIGIDPGFARAYFGKGKAFAGLGRHELAVEAYETAASLDPSLAPVIESYLSVSESIAYPSIPSGSLIKGSWRPGYQYLAVDNSGGKSDLVVALAPQGSGGATAAVYVAKGYSHKFEQIVPPGPYDVYITFGEHWNQREKAFARVGGYLKWELPRNFSGPERYGYTMTFITWQPAAGWWDYSLTPISQDEFPAL